MGRKLTTEFFIEKARKIHNYKYDYSLTIYNNSHEKVLIKCNLCGRSFEQIPNDHLNGCGCPFCSSKYKNRKSLEQFIKEANKVHNDKYDYSLVNYINNSTKVKIIHKFCNKVFEQTPKLHLRGQGCPYCFKSVKKTNEQFIKEIEKYNLDTSKVNYIANNKKVLLGCKNHLNDPKADANGVYWFLITPNALLKKDIACERCSKRPKMDTEDFIWKSKLLNGEEYDYSKVIYKNIRTNITLIHKKCGKEFEQSPSKHLNGQGCPFCKSSKGEKIIRSFLQSKNIKFEVQKTFDTLIDKANLSYDFYIPSKNLLIEYNGEQHYKPIKLFGGRKQFHLQLHHDWLKRKYAKENDINLLTISYKEDIIKKLEEKLNA